MKKEITETEKQTWEQLEAIPQKVLKLGIQEIALFVHASPATIVRTLKKFGYEGYSDYKSYVKHKITPNFSNFSIEVNKIIGKNLEEVEHTLAMLSPENVEHIVQALNRAKTVYIYSTGTTTAIANYITRKFNLSEKPCMNIDDDDLILYYSNQVKTSDIILVLSQSGETKSLITGIKRAKERDIQVILLTCGKGSTLHHLADYTLLAYKSQLGQYNFGVDAASRIPLQITARILLDCYSIYKHLGAIKNDDERIY